MTETGVIVVGCELINKSLCKYYTGAQCKEPFFTLLSGRLYLFDKFIFASRHSNSNKKPTSVVSVETYFLDGGSP